MSVALTRAGRQALDMTVFQIFRNRNQSAKKLDVGIEVEVEGQNLPIAIAEYWGAHKDNSLRGESMEYTLNGPIPQAQITDAMNVLDKAFKDNGSKINDSYRTSVHVHVNMQHYTLRDVYKFICMYIIFEDLLIDLCGRERAGNLFCLRTVDAEFLLDMLKKTAQNGRYLNLASDQLRYCAINVAAMGKYGSIEFRAYRGTTDKDAIGLWANLLCIMRNKSAEFKDPQDLCLQFSKLGPKGFVEAVFPAAIAGVFLRAKDLDERLYKGVRNAQDIAYYLKDWDPEAAKVEVQDPGKKYGMAKIAEIEGAAINEWGDERIQIAQEIERLRGRGAEIALVNPWQIVGAVPPPAELNWRLAGDVPEPIDLDDDDDVDMDDDDDHDFDEPDEEEDEI